MGDKVNVYEQGTRLAVFAMTEWESKDGKRSGTRFSQIGGASVNRDGSINLYLDLLPGQGQTCQLRTVKPREQGPDGAKDESPDRPF